MTIPAVSIILPTYNRARFLPEAIAAIRGQEFSDWELIVVDDGSDDGTDELIPQLCDGMTQSLRYTRQENQGAYAARNTGLDLSRGKYIAFYDSDDIWLPHHLRNCVSALETNADIDWVYGASRIVELDTARVANGNCFYENDGQPRRFLSLPVEVRSGLNVVNSDGLLTAVLNGAGLYAGLQNSVIRNGVFFKNRLVTDFYNEAEDQLVVLRAIADGSRFAYFNAVHVIYRIHDSNSSAAATGLKYERRVRLISGMIRGYEELRHQIDLAPPAQRALRRHLSRLYFWNLGYATNWMSGNRQAAFTAFQKGLRLDPWRVSYWKTYCLATLRSWFVPERQISDSLK